MSRFEAQVKAALCPKSFPISNKHHSNIFPMPSLPTLFEVVAADSLNDLLFPAFTKLAIKLANLDYRLIIIHNSKRLIYSFLAALLQIRYFKQYGGSMAEYFYSLTRTTVKLGKKSQAIMLLLNIIEASVGPVFSDYLQELLESLSNLQNPNQREQSLKFGISTALQLKKALKAAILLFNLLGMTTCANLWQSITGQRLVRIQAQDAQSSINTHGLILLALTRFINNEDGIGRKATKKRIPPPPPAYPAKINVVRGKCPICSKNVVNPAMSFGYVCCYTCLCEFVTSNKTCPVTLQTQDLEGIFRIYS